VSFDVEGFLSSELFSRTPTTVTINQPGSYMVLWSAAVTTPCILGVTLDRFQQNGLTSSGNAGRLFAHSLIEVTTAPTVLDLRNRLGTACTIAPEVPVLAPASVSATLIIVRLPS
jgi:hypothetical protein